jgi:quinone-modifying oxidoreductase, subunit QmoC
VEVDMKRDASLEVDNRLTPDKQAELSKEFLKALYALPEGDRIKLCIQCGTCSGSCPNAEKMEYSPREIIAALRAGMLSRVLATNTVWLCTSCYYCTVRCPQKIRFTDIMYELKRLGIKHGIYPKSAAAPVLSRTFVEMVDTYGRNPETLMMMKYYMRMGIKGMTSAIKNIPMAGELVKRKRMDINPIPKKIKGMDQIKKIVEHALAQESEGGA